MKLEEFGPRAKLAYQRIRAVIDRRQPDHAIGVTHMGVF